MPSLKEYNVKINSLTNTAKVTKTMNMVSISKFRKAKNAQTNSSYYASYLNNLINRFMNTCERDLVHPLMKVKDKTKKKALVIVCASDRGLCGGFNNNLFKFVNRWFKDNQVNYNSVDFISSSKRATSASQKLGIVIKQFENIAGNPNFDMAYEISRISQNKFLASEYSKVYIAYNIFESALVQIANMQQLLPLKPINEVNDMKKQKINNDYIYEPNKEELLDLLIPKVISFQIFNALLESAAGEHVARMTAMDSATTNAMKIIDTYTVKRNRARQTQITTELTEIVAGSESLK